MEYLNTIELTIPAFQIIALLFFGTMSLLFGKLKLALMINYIFTLYWGYFVNKDLLFEHYEEAELYIFMYFGFGLIAVIFAMIGFIMYQKE